MNFLYSYKMGCLGSNEMPLNETKKIENDDKKNSPKNNELADKRRANDDNLIINNYILKENNVTKEDENKNEIENKINDIKAIKEKLHLNKENNYLKDKFENEDKDYKKQVVEEAHFEDKTRIDLVYFVNSKGFFHLFGKDFIEINKDNIELIVNF